jgi:hypothetical protein
MYGELRKGIRAVSRPTTLMREVKNTKIFSEVWEVRGVRERFDIRIAGPGMIFRQYSSLRESR